MRAIFKAYDRINKRDLNISSIQLNADGSIAGVWELKEGENELYGMHQIEVSLVLE